MKRIWNLLGSVQLAIFLIASAACFVAVGTFIESKTDSHLQAAHIVYENPLFTVLLWMFLVNIAVSALRRYPFKKKHIPFLITHLGLLMIFGGLLVKTYFGLQGALLVVEGSGNHELLLPNTYALSVEEKDSKNVYPLSDALPKEIKIKNWIPHCERKLEYWIKGGQFCMLGFDPVSLDEKPWTEPIVTLSDGWAIFAGRTNDLEDSMRQLSKHEPPLFAFVLDESNKEEIVLSIDSMGEVSQNTFSQDGVNQMLAYEGGYGGYGVELELETLSPVTHLFRKTCEKNGVPFEALFIEYLTTWKESEEWLFPKNAKLSKNLQIVLNELDWKQFSYAHLHAAKWSVHVIEQNATFVNTPWEKYDEEARYQKIMNDLAESAKHLPPPPEVDDKQLFSALLRMNQKVCLSCPLTQAFTPLPPSEKLEDNKPLLVLSLPGETLPLLYDATASGWKWPSKDKKHLYRFQPQTVTLPYHVRLQDARKLSFPSNGQPFSYEARLYINREEVTLSLNYVHQTWDGYRFYLAGVTPEYEGALKRVHLVVNYDPAKYFLTYPGAIVLAIGILLLFWIQPFYGEKKKS